MKNSKLTCAVPLVLLAPEICITNSLKFNEYAVLVLLVD
jgi:hypothetical protein